MRHHRLVRRVAGGMVVADAARDRVGIRVRNVHPGVAEPHPFPPPNGRVDVVHHVVRDVCAGQRPVPGTSGTADALDAPPRVFHGTPDPVGRGSAPRDPRSADEEHPRRGHRLPKPGRGPSPIGKRSSGVRPRLLCERPPKRRRAGDHVRDREGPIEQYTVYGSSFAEAEAEIETAGLARRRRERPWPARKPGR